MARVGENRNAHRLLVGKSEAWTETAKMTGLERKIIVK